MNTNENTRTDVQEDVIELGVASVETLGQPGLTDEAVFHRIMPGISEE